MCARSLRAHSHAGVGGAGEGALQPSFVRSGTKKTLCKRGKNPAGKIFDRQNKQAIERACWQTHTSDLFSHSCFEVSRAGGVAAVRAGAGWA